MLYGVTFWVRYMAHQMILDESLLEGFTEPAKRRVASATLDYVTGIVGECYRLEGAERRDDGPVEVTSSMVDLAVNFERLRPPQQKRKFRRYLVKIAASLFPFFIGIFFDAENLKSDTIHLVIFILSVAITAIIVTLHVAQEG